MHVTNKKDPEGEWNPRSQTSDVSPIDPLEIEAQK